MRRIRLDLNQLAVVWFPLTGSVGMRPGTVRGHQEPLDPPTLHTGYHGCYGCPASVLVTCIPCDRDTLLCPDTVAAE